MTAVENGATAATGRSQDLGNDRYVRWRPMTTLGVHALRWLKGLSVDLSGCAVSGIAGAFVDIWP